MEIDRETERQERFQKIRDGFSIHQVVIRDQESGEIYWDSSEQHDFLHPQAIMEAHMPAKLLHSKAITRQIRFSSVEKMQKLTLSQKAFLGTDLVESFNFNFGFVIPNSTNNWDQTILSAGPENMIPVSMLSGNLVILISFFEDQQPIYEVKIRVFYD